MLSPFSSGVGVGNRRRDGLAYLRIGRLDRVISEHKMGLDGMYLGIYEALHELI